MLTRDAILGASDLQRETVHVPEWQGEVIVRSLTGREREELETEALNRDKLTPGDRLRGLKVRLVVMTAIDGEGQRLFRDEDAEALMEKNARAIDRVFAATQQLSGLTKEDVEELVGNSSGDRNDSSGSS